MYAEEYFLRVTVQFNNQQRKSEFEATIRLRRHQGSIMISHDFHRAGNSNRGCTNMADGFEKLRVRKVAHFESESHGDFA
jgi:hypothetical protein